MADVQDNELTTGESATSHSAEKPDKAKGGKKKKKKRGCGFFLLLTLLVAGVAAGVQASGGADLRPYVYEIVPRLPWVGEQAADLLGIPETYSLTLDERRRIELDEWETAIADKVRSLDAQLREVGIASADLSRMGEELTAAQEDLRLRIEALSGDMEGGAEGLSTTQRDELDRIVRTFEEMSPKNAAAILERLSEPLAVPVLDQLAEDFRARALGRMDPTMAAGLMERLSEYQNRNN